MFQRGRRPGAPFMAGAPLLIAHRGGAALAPENTLAAFGLAVSRWQADIIELDLRVTGDGELVVIHDATVDRTTDGTGLVSQLSIGALRELDAGYRFTDLAGAQSFRAQAVQVPLFREVLEAFPNLRITAELKEPAGAEPFLRIVRRHGAEQRVLLAAIHERSRRAVRGRYRGPSSASRTDAIRFFALNRLRVAGWFTPKVDVFQLPEYSGRWHLVTPQFVRGAHRANTPVHVWTVNDASDMHRLLEMGVDGILSDRPDILARVLHDRVNRPLPPGVAASESGAVPTSVPPAESGGDAT